MFREMRRKNQLLSEEESLNILKNGSHGVLALSGDDGYPYAVPLSYAYDRSKLYFHCAKTGHKIDAVKSCGKASFCVVDKDEVVPEKYTTYFRSAIAFGTIRILEDEAEKLEAIQTIAVKYHPKGSAEDRQREIREGWDHLCILELSIEHLTGKEAKELVKKRLSP